MKRTKVESSNVVSVGYDKEKKILEVEFGGNSVYQYSNVEPKLYECLIKSKSKGRFVAVFVKFKYQTKRIIEKKEE